MSLAAATLAGLGDLIEPTTLRIERVLPGPIERIWTYLTDSKLRGKWLASGEMELRIGGRVELIWRNAELTPHNEKPPEGQSEEHRMVGAVTALDAPRMIEFDWPNVGSVTFELVPSGSEVRFIVTHRKIPNRGTKVGVSAGWHAHLDVLVDVANNRVPEPFWPRVQRLRAEYDKRIPE